MGVGPRLCLPMRSGVSAVVRRFFVKGAMVAYGGYSRLILLFAFPFIPFDSSICILLGTPPFSRVAASMAKCAGFLWWRENYHGDRFRKKDLEVVLCLPKIRDSTPRTKMKKKKTDLKPNRSFALTTGAKNRFAARARFIGQRIDDSAGAAALYTEPKAA